MSERKYYCFCDSNCKFETMTKEQILAAIAQAVETGSVGDCDTGFVTKIKELNGGKTVTFWVGRQVEYNALQEKDSNCMYIITDDTLHADIDKALKEATAAAAACQSIDITNEISLTLQKGANYRDYIFHGYDDDGKPITTPIAPYRFSYDRGAGIVRFELHVRLTEVTPRKSLNIVKLGNYIPQATMQALSIADQQCFGDYSAYLVSNGSTAAIAAFAAQGLGEYEANDIDISGWYFYKGE